jgi:hypothetical protein
LRQFARLSESGREMFSAIALLVLDAVDDQRHDGDERQHHQAAANIAPWRDPSCRLRPVWPFSGHGIAHLKGF